MASKPDRLAKLFVDSAFEFYRRRLWNEIGSNAISLLRISGEDEPVTANVIGQALGEYGLGLVRGPGAFSADGQHAL